MPELVPSNLDRFIARFDHLYDGVVRDVRVRFTPEYTYAHVALTLSVRDRETSEDNGWVNLTLEIGEVTQFILIEGNGTCSVLSNGLSVGFFDERIYLDFCPHAEASDSLADFLKSRFLVAGKNCVWTISPYTDTIPVVETE